MAHDHIGIRIFDDVVRADVACLVEPESGYLREHLPLAWDRRQNSVEGAQPVRRDDDAASVRKIVIVPDLAPVMVRQLRNRRVRQNAVEMRREVLGFEHAPPFLLPVTAPTAVPATPATMAATPT